MAGDGRETQRAGPPRWSPDELLDEPQVRIDEARGPAGIAIENARLYEEGRLRERWLAASSAFTSALLSGSAETEVLEGMPAGAVDTAAPALGFPPALRMEGLIDTDVPQDVADHVIAVIVEALSNIVRHAGAKEAEVSVVADDGAPTVSATDDGVGLPDCVRGSGLRNLTERADPLGGTFSVTGRGAPSGGTALEWRVPLPPGRGGGAFHTAP